MGYTTDGWLQFENGTVLSDKVRLMLVIPVSIYGILLLVAGSLGNFGVAFVLIYDRRRLKMTTRVLFCLLAVADTMVLWIAVLRYCIRVTIGWDFRAAYPFACRMHVLAVYMSTNLAVTVFCVLCVDRCFVICHSLEGYRTHFVQSNTTSNVSERATQSGIRSVVLSRPYRLQHHTHHSKCVLFSMRLFQCTRVRRVVNRLLCCVNPCFCTCTRQKRDQASSTAPRISLQFQSVNSSASGRSQSFACFHSHQQSLRMHRKAILERYSPRFSSALEGTSSNMLSPPTSNQNNSFCNRLSSVYTRHSSRWLSVGLILGFSLVIIKHLVAYRYVRVEPIRGCYGSSLARWRDYMDFITQAILPYFIIIPANAWLYRSIKRHQKVLAALRMFISRGSASSSPLPPSNDMARTCEYTNVYPNLVNARTKYTFTNLRDSHAVGNSSVCHTGPRHRQVSAKVMVATATHLSKSHLFIFKTLITLSILHFVINLPGHLYAQLILPSLSDWWFSTVEGHLLYDSLFLISYTNNGASFFILLCTNRGFRLRFCSTIKRSCIGRAFAGLRRYLKSLSSVRSTTGSFEIPLGRTTSKCTINPILLDLETSQIRASCLMDCATYNGNM